MLDEEENVIEVAAVDLAGNRTVADVVVEAKYSAPVITNLKPDEDWYLSAGVTVVVEFESEPGLDGSFSVLMPLTNFNLQATNPIELPVVEIVEGKYVGYWSVPGNMKADGAEVQVKVEDEFGNVGYKKAEGRLYLE